MTIATTIGIIAMQVAMSCYGQYKNKKSEEEKRRLKEDAKQDSLSYEKQRDSERFRRSCSALLELERNAHQENLKDIETSFKSAFETSARRAALESYPLTISPYLIKNSILSFNNTDESVGIRPQLFAVLSASNNRVFNRLYFPVIDSITNSTICEYWNAHSTHTICFYENTWDRNMVYDDIHPHNLQALIPHAPIIMITPYLEPRDDEYNIIFKICYWGINEPIFIKPTDLPNIRIPEQQKKLTPDPNIESLCGPISQWVTGIMGLFSDIYYWTVFHMSPVMPLILCKEPFSSNAALVKYFINAYIELNESNCSHNKTLIDSEEPLIVLYDDIRVLNTVHFPEQNIRFMKAVAQLTGDTPMTDDLVWDTLSYLYWVRSEGQSVNSYDEMNVSLFSTTDMMSIVEAAQAARLNHQNNAMRTLSLIIKRRVESGL